MIPGIGRGGRVRSGDPCHCDRAGTFGVDRDRRGGNHVERTGLDHERDPDLTQFTGGQSFDGNHQLRVVGKTKLRVGLGDRSLVTTDRQRCVIDRDSRRERHSDGDADQVGLSRVGDLSDPVGGSTREHRGRFEPCGQVRRGVRRGSIREVVPAGQGHLGTVGTGLRRGRPAVVTLTAFLRGGVLVGSGGRCGAGQCFWSHLGHWDRAGIEGGGGKVSHLVGHDRWCGLGHGCRGFIGTGGHDAAYLAVVVDDPAGYEFAPASQLVGGHEQAAGLER